MHSGCAWLLEHRGTGPFIGFFSLSRYLAGTTGIGVPFKKPFIQEYPTSMFLKTVYLCSYYILRLHLIYQDNMGIIISPYWNGWNQRIPSPTHPPICMCHATTTPNLNVLPKIFGCSANTRDLSKLKSKASTKKN